MPTLIPPAANADNHSRPARFLRYESSRVVGEMSVEQYLDFDTKTDEKHDYVWGKVVRVPGASLEHIRITSNLNTFFTIAVDQVRADVEIMGNDTKVRVEGRLYRYPDLVIVEHEPDMGLNKTLRNPAVLVEVLSESTQSDDLTDKFREYRQIESLRYYIVVEQKRVSVTVYGKQENGVWGIIGDYRRLSETLILTLDEKQITIPLSLIYRRVFSEDNEQP